jgi:hypothetical protein
MTKPHLAFAAGLLLLPACDNPSRKLRRPVRDEDNPIMQIQESYANMDGLVSLTFDIEKSIDPKEYGQDASLVKPRRKGFAKRSVLPERSASQCLRVAA